MFPQVDNGIWPLYFTVAKLLLMFYNGSFIQTSGWFGLFELAWVLAKYNGT